MTTLNISYTYDHHEERYLPHVAVTSSEDVAIFSGEAPQNNAFIQDGEREDITIVSGEKQFKVEQVRGEPYLRILESSLPVTLRLNGLTFETIADERGYR